MRLAEAPHFLLFSESTWQPGQQSRWRFCLEALPDGQTLEAFDDEPAPNQDRLELLAVVRGLESLDQPSHVTLVTASNYVSRGLRFGLQNWRERDWCWESYGRWTSIRDADLWRRVDGALQYHQVRCRLWAWSLPSSSRPATNRPESKAASNGPASRLSGPEVGLGRSSLADGPASRLANWWRNCLPSVWRGPRTEPEMQLGLAE